MTADAFDLSERLQTPVIMMSDLDLGMNFHMTPPLKWNPDRKYDRGKVLGFEDLESMEQPWGRYLDIDDDGICYRTIPANMLALPLFMGIGHWTTPAGPSFAVSIMKSRY